MKKYVLYGFIFLFIFSGKGVFAQFYSTGQDPSVVRWNQINSEHFQIIFDRDFESKAQEIANILEYYYKQANFSLDHEPRKISVIVHNQTIRSNGYVSWAPKRMELFTTPSQDILPEPWLEHLCLHEMRHVVQIDKLNQGITKILSVLFGQMAVGMAAGQLPMWYYEGDAVSTETVFGKFGRGRSPMFEKNIRTHLLSDEKQFTIDQMLFGSYGRYIPNHYEFGYQLTAYLRTKYGAKSWSSIHDHVARNSFTFFPTPLAFSAGLKKQYGINQKQLFKGTLNYLDSIYKVEEIDYKAIQAKRFQQYTIDGYEDYINPISIDNQKVICLKKGLGHIPQFVLITPEKETAIFEPGILVSDDFSAAKNFIVWAEYKPHFRWQNKEYSTIKMVNIETKKERLVVSKSRYFSPDISADANKIAVVEVSTDNQCYLTIISSFKGDIIYRVPSTNFIMRPKWSPDSKSVYFIELTDSGKQVSKYSVENNSWEVIFAFENTDIQRIIPTEKYVFFHSTLNGRDEVYLFDPSTKDKYQMSLSSSGIVDFCIDKNAKDIIIAEHSSQGNRLAVIPIERGLWKDMSEKTNKQMHFSEKLTDQEKFISGDEKIPAEKYTTKAYNKLMNGFNFHSWIPFYFDYSNESINGFLSDPGNLIKQIHPGVMLLSQNKLSTAESILGYAYKNGHHYIQSSVIYKGFVPVITLSADYGNIRQYFAPDDTDWHPEIGYNDLSYNIDIYLPVNFSTGKMSGGFIPRINVDYHNTYYYHFLDDYYVAGNEFFTEQLMFYWLKRTSHRDIQPTIGIVFNYELQNTPLEKELFGYMSSIDGTLYLPGFFKNHGIKLNAGYQFQDPKLYLYGSNFDFPHGIEEFRTEKFKKIYCDYVFPIAYPDWSLGPVFYVKRIKSNVFFNYANNKFRAKNNSTNTIYWANYNLVSYGIELSADYHLLRMIFPLNTGIRIGYTNFSNNVFSEVIFGIDISGM